MFRTAVWLFQLPYNLDRTGVRVMVMCPGVTDTALIADSFGRLLREEWADFLKMDLGQLFKQKWVFVIKERPFLRSSYTSDFP